MTKAEQIIERLGGIRRIDELAWEVHPILIGDVLTNFWKNWRGKLNDDGLLKFLDLWGACGANRSLQEIAEDWDRTNPASYDTIKPEAKALIEFLHSIFITE